MDNTNNNPPRATLADKEAREFGIEPLDAATAARKPFAVVRDEIELNRYESRAFAETVAASCGGRVVTDRENRDLGIEPMDAATPVQYAALGRRRAIAAALLENATVPRRCKACGGGSVYLSTRPGLEFCTSECAERGPSPARVISSAMDIDLSGVPMGGIPTLPEDRAASSMFDGPEPTDEEPSVSIGELIVERDEAIAALDRVLDELHRVRAENEALRKQLTNATDRARAYVRGIKGGQ